MKKNVLNIKNNSYINLNYRPIPLLQYRYTNIFEFVTQEQFVDLINLFVDNLLCSEQLRYRSGYSPALAPLHLVDNRINQIDIRIISINDFLFVVYIFKLLPKYLNKVDKHTQ